MGSRHRHRCRGRFAVPLVATVLALTAVVRPAVAEPDAVPAPPSSEAAPAGVPAGERARVLGPDWQQSSDRVVVEDGDATGLHLLVADAKDGYQWRTAATLTEQGVDTDQWIGQHCLSSSGRYAVVVYAPRQAVNHEDMFRGGGLAAIVDLDRGSVRKLPFPVSLAYYNPGCGAHEDAAFTRNFFAGEKYVSQLRTVDLATGEVTRTIEAPGQLTSAVPYRGGMAVATSAGPATVDDQGRTKLLAPTNGSPFRLTVDTGDGLGYETRTDHTEVHRFDGTRDATLASVPLDSVQLHQVGGQVFLQGKARITAPHAWRQVDVSPEAELSTTGALAVTSVDNHRQGAGAGNDEARQISIQADALATRVPAAFTVTPQAVDAAAGSAPSPALGGSGAESPHRSAADPATDTTDPNRGCAVARNDPKIEALQPTPAMGEWAADLAVKNALTVQRPAHWNGSDLPAYTPQGMFPSHPLTGGGQVPVQILLGVMAQESNMWQASPHATDGESGNFEIGGFYGKNVGLDTVNFNNVDCGYGATQVTTGMSVREGNTVYTPTQQLAIAVDYAANIAAGLQILQDKWNQLRGLGLMVNDGNPAYLENWWYALWAYNTGWHNQGADASGQYGLGWTNNMANEDLLLDRHGYLDATYDDARHPNHWSYPERVIGWARHALLRLNWKTGEYGAAYRTGIWGANVTTPSRPRFGEFCTAAVQCDMAQIHKPGEYPDDPGSHCLRDDLKCWWHSSVVWTTCAANCGTENLAYQPGAPEPSPASRRLYNPDCSTNGLPGNALIVDDVPAGVQTQTGCGKTWVNHGTLGFRFSADPNGKYVSKIDFHQLDTGFGGHMWFAHTWGPDVVDVRHRIEGTWTLDQQLGGWARVLVYIPDHGAMTPQAVYRVGGTDSTSPNRTIVEGNYLDDNRRPAPGHWESLGAFNFTGTPTVTLANTTTGVLNAGWADSDGERAVPWDAVAFVPLGRKPADQVVALGDSYASGEGASNDPVDGAWDFYRSSDHDGTDSHGDDRRFRDACHRSPNSWSRQMRLPNTTTAVGTRADTLDPTLTYHMSACSGATTPNLKVTTFGQYQEGSQVDQGFLDQHTTLVTLSIGGNDARFTDIMTRCTLGTIDLCQNTTLDGDTKPLAQAEPERINGPVLAGIEKVLAGIHRLAPNARILLMGYPKLMENAGGCIPGIGTGEYPWLVQMGDLLDQTIAKAALWADTQGYGVTYADPRAAFNGRGACADDALIHGVVLPLPANLTRGEDGLSQQSLHPNTAGASVYAGVATEALR
ncbi:MAG TPA: SGNH/GDSL hydrolase family protein [Actinophytocola sp.]|nr:SGNH/GDSL hydrolase family protein [Actinophytocola sp.]